MDKPFYLDSCRLRDLSVELKQKEYAARELFSQIERAKRFSDDTFLERYTGLLQKAEKLITYFSAFAAAAENTSDDAEDTVIKISQMLDDTSETVKSVTSRILF